jgi:hypothetical protein
VQLTPNFDGLETVGVHKDSNLFCTCSVIFHVSVNMKTGMIAIITRLSSVHLVLLLVTLVGGNSDSNGASSPTTTSTVLCICSPPRIQWSLDFDGTCETSSIVTSKGVADSGDNSNSAGVKDAFCSIKAVDPAVDDLRPTKVTDLIIFELGTSLEAIQTQVDTNLDLANGGVFSFTSITAAAATAASSPMDDEAKQYTYTYPPPGGLFARLTAENANGDVLYNDWVIDYTNACNAPAFQGNGKERFGWTVFVSEVCAMQ